MKQSSPRVSIGLPTFNRPELLARAIDNFRQQTFSDFELLISDNASTDSDVARVCESVVKSDSRFRYVRQPINLGAAANFWFVFDQAVAPLFLWASDDDVWPFEFLERGIAGLDADPSASAWFCQVANITRSGEMVRNYPSFGRFSSTSIKILDLARFLWEPEVMGKANLIYSIFRRNALQDVVDIIRSRPFSWGTDMNLVYGFLCRHNIAINDGVVLKKRLSVDVVDEVLLPRKYIYPRSERKIYFDNYRRVSAGTRYAILTTIILVLRLGYDKCFHAVFESTLFAQLTRVGRAVGRVIRMVSARFGGLA